MAEGLTGIDQIRECFGLKDQDLRTYSPLTLAFLGDAVYEQIIRAYLVAKGNCPVNRLHHMAISYVSAGAQARLVDRIGPLLTEEEQDIYRRGKNAGVNNGAKHATLADYRSATGWEALIGYLYLKGQSDRIMTLVAEGIEGK
ncbi:MAG: ribonuclease III [Blautia sp.]|nr:ribonuclease III [Blautia sp.]